MKKLTHWHTILLGVCAGISLSFFTLPLWVVALTSFTRDGNRSDWLGFVGAIVGAVATLVAAGMALFAAYKTLAPVRAQLSQLMKQNDYILFERLSQRANNLNSEEILVQKVAANCEVVSRSLDVFKEDQSTIRYGVMEVNRQTAFVTGLRVAVERLGVSIEAIQKQKGEVWGSVKTQDLRRQFIDMSLRAGSFAIKMSNTAEGLPIAAASELKNQMQEWRALSSEIHSVGAQLHQLCQIEGRRIGAGIADVEKRLF